MVVQLCFNPSQVGYKLMREAYNGHDLDGFNPSQVGYKLDWKSIYDVLLSQFQSLTGRLQTRLEEYI